MDHRKTYAGVFGIAGSTLVLEILATRITSVVAWYHLAFFVISLAMLGMTAGAVIVFVRPRWFTDELVPRRLAESALAVALASPFAIWVALSIKLQPITDTDAFLAMLAYGGALAVPFTLSGITLTLALTRAGLPAGIVYGVDLVGAAGGCVAVIALLDVVDAPSGVLVAAAGAALSAALFAAARPDGEGKRIRNVASACAAALLAAGLANARAADPWLSPTWVKGEKEVASLYEYTGWNTYSRVTVLRTLPLPPALWAPARTIPKPMMRLMPQRAITIDGAAGTMLASFDTDLEDDKPGSLDQHEYLAWDVTSFAHRMRPRGPAAVIGVGGGRDILEAVRVGHRPVIGIELNDLIIGLHTDGMREFSGIADLPGVTLATAEARSYMAGDKRQYSVITMSLIDTWAATGAGAYALSENGLYTTEGWQIFMDRLEPTGIFTVSRWYKPDSPGETARMLALAMETLWRTGAKDPLKHIILLQNQSIATLLVSPTPFSKRDIDLMQKEAVLRGFNMMLTPRKLPVNPLLRELAGQKTRAEMWQWANEQLLDLTPPTDERPFFFNMLRPSTWFEAPEEVDTLDHAFLGNLHATQTLVYATIISLALTFIAVVFPLWAQRKALKGYPKVDLGAACIYFALIGLGFMFVEIGLLSRLNVFLGHPTLALSVLLGGIIFFAGLGSLASERLDVGRAWIARGYPLIAAVLVSAAGFGVDPLLAAFTAAPVATRVMVGIVLVAIPALGMGFGFPLGLRLVAGIGGTERAALGPWMWGVNGACGVVATGLALTSSMAWGISTTLSIGAVCYFVLPLATWRLHASGRARSPEA